MERYATEAAKLVAATEEANRVGRESLAAAQRAWLRPRVSIASPLTYDPANNGMLMVTILVILENLGHSPATKAHVEIELVSQGVEPGQVPDLRVAQRDLSARTKSRRDNMLDRIVFPTNSLQNIVGMNHILNIPREKIDFVTKAHPLFAPAVIGCVDYQFPFTETHHQTWFAYAIVRRSVAGKLSMIGYDGVDIAQEDLALQEPFVSEKYAD
jgi:hypothetical protein